MPGEVSRSSRGPKDGTPYVPSWCYRNGPKECPCGHHEGYHNDAGECVLGHQCHCKGLPPECLTSPDEML